MAVEHIDNLLADWFSTLDTHQTIHGDRSVRRVSLCPDCLTERIHRREEVTRPNDTATEEDSGCHNNGDAESNQGKTGLIVFGSLTFSFLLKNYG